MSDINELVLQDQLQESKIGNIASKAAGGSVAAVYAFYPSLVVGGVIGTIALLTTLSIPIAMLLATVAFGVSWGGAATVGSKMAGSLHGRFERKEELDKKMIDYYNVHKNDIKLNLVKAAKSGKLDKKVSDHILDLAKEKKGE